MFWIDIDRYQPPPVTSYAGIIIERAHQMQIQPRQIRPNGTIPKNKPCDHCKQTGLIDGVKCKACAGNGGYHWHELPNGGMADIISCPNYYRKPCDREDWK